MQNEDKDIHKICPFFGYVPSVAKLQGITKISPTAVAMQITLIDCQKERCQLWTKTVKECCINMISRALTAIAVEQNSNFREIMLKAAVESIKEAKEDGNS